MKQLLALILVIAALLGILAGCGTAKSGSNDSKKEETQEKDEETEPSQEESMYQSTAKLYVNTGVNTNEDMVPTFITIIDSNAVIDPVKEEFPDTNFTVKIDRINDSDVIAITVYSKKQKDVAPIVNAIAEKAAKQICNIVEGTSVKIVDYGKEPTQKGSPEKSVNADSYAYKCTVKLYVNRSVVSAGGESPEISNSDITASKTIIDTYKIIIQSDTVMNEVKEYCCITLNASGASYSDIEDLEEFAIHVEQVENTQIIAVTVYADEEAFTGTVAYAIAAIVPAAIQNIVEGTSCKVVDSGIAEENK